MSHKSKLKEAAALFEIVASIAVIVSLVFVIQSINQNTLAIQSANDNVLYELQSQRLISATENPLLAEAITKFDRGEELDDQQQLIYRFWTMQGLNMWEMSFSRYKAGLLPHDQWESWNGMWFGSFPEWFPHDWWLGFRHEYGVAFRNHVDAAYAAHEARLQDVKQDR